MTRLSKHVLPPLLLMFALPVAAQTMDTSEAASKQAATAAAHAGMAMDAADLATTHKHLHHVVNCLVGPSGKGFDAKVEDPCKGMGHGAIVDAKGNTAMRDRLHMALSQAERGLKDRSLQGAHADAKQAMQTLQKK